MKFDHDRLDGDSRKGEGAARAGTASAADAVGGAASQLCSMLKDRKRAVVAGFSSR